MSDASLRALRWLARAALLALLAARFFPGIGDHEIHGDENWYPRTSSEFFLLLAVDRNWDAPAWTGANARVYPMLGRYLLGASIWLGAGEAATRRTAALPMWQWQESREWNVSNGRAPPHEATVAGRTGMAVFGVLACLALYALGTLVWNAWVGLLGAAMLGLNPLTAHCARYAMLDAPLLFFMTAMPIATVGVLRAYRRGQTARWVGLTIVVGVLGGFATATKPNGALGLIAFGGIALVLAVEAVGRAWRSDRTTSPMKACAPAIAIGLLAAVTSVGLFVGSQPNLHRDPVGEIEEMIWYRRISNRNMLRTQPASAVLATSRDKLERVVERVFVPGSYSLFERVPVELVFFPVGLFFVARREWQSWRNEHRIGDDAVLIAWAAVTIVGVSAWIPFDWDRYFLPLLPPIAMFTAVGIAECTGAVARRFGPFRTAPT